MIPPFDDNGYLPPGIHRATLDEIRERFGQANEIRRAQMDSIGWLVELATQAGIERIVLNGSWVTDVEEPNDVDCVLLIGPLTATSSPAYLELDEGLPFLGISLVEQEDFEQFVNDTFATDRRRVAKGMIEVM